MARRSVSQLCANFEKSWTKAEVNHAVGRGCSAAQAFQIFKIASLHLRARGDKRFRALIPSARGRALAAPALINSLTTAEPIKPVAPVTNTRIPFSLCCSYIYLPTRGSVLRRPDVVNDYFVATAYLYLEAAGKDGTLCFVKSKKRPYHHGDLRDALLQAGEAMLERVGPEALSMRELAREVGVSNNAPRRHFASKQALLDALALQGFERLGAALNRALADQDKDFEKRLVKLARANIRFASSHRALRRLMFTAKQRETLLRKLWRRPTRDFRQALRRSLTARVSAPSVLVIRGLCRSLCLPRWRACSRFPLTENSGAYRSNG